MYEIREKYSEWIHYQSLILVMSDQPMTMMGKQEKENQGKGN